MKSSWIFIDNGYLGVEGGWCFFFVCGGGICRIGVNWFVFVVISSCSGGDIFGYIFLKFKIVGNIYILEIRGFGIC